ncbi:cobalamin synthase [compost metagenome]
MLGGGSLLTSMALALGLGLPALGFGVLLARRLAAKLGGLTGDTYGAINELTETFLLLVILVLSRFY